MFLSISIVPCLGIFLSVMASAPISNDLERDLLSNDPLLCEAAAERLNGMDYHDRWNMSPALRKAAEHSNKKVKLAALRAIVVTESAQARPIVAKLIRLLDDDDPGIRRGAIEAITQRAEARVAIPSFIRRLDDPEEVVREVAFNSIRTIGAAPIESLPEILTLLRSSNHRIRSAAVIQLGWMKAGSAESITSLIRIAREEDSSELRSFAIEALGRVGPNAEVAIPDLRRALNSPERREVLAAIEALGSLGLRAKAAVPQLVHLAQAPDPKTRDAAIGAIGAIGAGTDAAIRMLNECLKDQALRKACEAALARLGSPPHESLEYLIQGLGDRDVSVRLWCAVKIGDLGVSASPAVPHLTKLLDDDSRQVSLAAVKALGQIGSSAGPAVPALTRMLRNQVLLFGILWDYSGKHVLIRDVVKGSPASEAGLVYGDRISAVGGISTEGRSAGEIGEMMKAKPGTALDLTVLHRTHGVSDQVREIQLMPVWVTDSELIGPIGEALAKIGDILRDAIPPLWRECQYPTSEPNRSGAIKALGVASAKFPEVVALATTSLQGQNVDLRRAAASILGGASPSASVAVPALFDALRDQEQSVVAAALEALSEIRQLPPEGAQMAAELLRNSYTRAIAVSGLQRLGPGVEAAATLLESVAADPKLGRMAVAALSEIAASTRPGAPAPSSGFLNPGERQFALARKLMKTAHPPDWAFEVLRDERAIPTLELMARDRFNSSTSVALSYLGSSRSTHAAAALFGLLTFEDESLAMGAAHQLLKFDPRQEFLIRAALKDASGLARRRMSLSIAMLGASQDSNRVFIPELREAFLRFGEMEVLEAISALEPRAVHIAPRLIELLDDPQAGDSAFKALSKMSIAVQPLLREHIHHPRRAVRSKVERLISESSDTAGKALVESLRLEKSAQEGMGRARSQRLRRGLMFGVYGLFIAIILFECWRFYRRFG